MVPNRRVIVDDHNHFRNFVGVHLYPRVNCKDIGALRNFLSKHLSNTRRGAIVEERYKLQQ